MLPINPVIGPIMPASLQFDVGENKVFGKDFNKVFLIDKNNCEEWSEQTKKSVASNLADKINKILITTNI